MNSQLKILLYSGSHISRTLTKMKLVKQGHAVNDVESFDGLKDDVKVHFYDVVIVDASCSNGEEIFDENSKLKSPVLFLETDDSIPVLDKKLLMKPSFTEEEFLHKFQYGLSLQQNKQNADSTLREIIMSHYAGDKPLAQRICRAFLEGYEGHLSIIKEAFLQESDSDLAKKIHAFKGALSALGDTPAAKLLRKIEILVKGRQKAAAVTMLEKLYLCCKELAEEAESLIID